LQSPAQPERSNERSYLLCFLQQTEFGTCIRPIEQGLRTEAALLLSLRRRGFVEFRLREPEAAIFLDRFDSE
jgi:hypothetical protein